MNIQILIICTLIINVALIVIFYKMAMNVKLIKEHLIQGELIKIKDKVLRAKLLKKIGKDSEAHNLYLEADFYLTEFITNKKPNQSDMGVVEYRNFVFLSKEIKNEIKN